MRERKSVSEREVVREREGEKRDSEKEKVCVFVRKRGRHKIKKVPGSTPARPILFKKQLTNLSSNSTSILSTSLRYNAWLKMVKRWD